MTSPVVNAPFGTPGAVSPELVNWTLNNTDTRQGMTIVDAHGNEFEIAPTFAAGPQAASGSFPSGGLSSFLPAGFFSQLQPATWRGQPFAVLGSNVRVGRRKALHEYPFRDGLWVEDLGQRGRVYGFMGFLVGDDVGQQMEAFLKRSEAPGLGQLVHPTFGARQVELLECDAGDRWDAGRVWTLRLEFVEPRAPQLQRQPEFVRDTGAGVAAAADGAQAAAGGDFLSRVGSALKSGYQAAQGVVAAVKPYVQAAVKLAGDATRLLNSVRGLAGSVGIGGGAVLGRYSLGRGGVIGAAQAGLRTATQVQGAVRGAIQLGANARGFVEAAGSNLSRLVGL